MSPRESSPQESSPEEFFVEVAARHRRCFWLDGGGARDWSGSRSIIGWLDDDGVSLSYDATRRTVTEHRAGETRVVGSDPFAVLEERIAAGEQWFGWFGYAARADLPASTDPSLPDAVWMRADHVRQFDHATPTQPGPAAPPGTTGPTPAAYAAAFAEVQEQLRAGNSYEVNLTHRVTVRDDMDPATAYLRLRSLNPAPYAGFLAHDVPGARSWLLSSSPERYALVRGGVLETKPIKGTAPRSDDPVVDAALRDALATDPKTRAENLMVVDLLRNDLSMVCAPGTVEVPALMATESYANVHQLVSTVTGRLRAEGSTVGALRALFPAGSMTGAPKLRTMEIIEDVESTPRGVYAGAFGWIGGDGDADLGVVIRSLTTDGSGTWWLGTGGGITVRSDVDAEWSEAVLKADRLQRVFGEPT